MARERGSRSRGPFRLCNTLVKPSQIHQIAGIPIVSCRIAWIKVKSALVLSLGRRPIPLMSLRDEAERSVGLSECVIEVDCFHRRFFRS